MIRRFRPGDAARLKEITLICFEGVAVDHAIEQRYGVVGDKDWRWRKARHIDGDIAADPEGIFVYEVDGEVVGYITTRCDREAKIGWVANIGTLPACRGRGIGRALMERALARFREQGMALAKIETLEQNTIGQAFYPSVGFQEIARQIHYVKEL